MYKLVAATLHINISAVTENWRMLDNLSAPNVETGAVIKANGYSVGTTKLAPCLRDVGVKSFFIAQAQEGQNIRKSLADESKIYVFGGHMDQDAEHLKKYQLIPLLNSKDQFTLHMQQLPNHPFGLQLNTGMNRLGFDQEEFNEILPDALDANPVLIMSHLACADEPLHQMNAQQLKVFYEMTRSLNIPKSLAATGGILLGPNYHFDLTRPGIGLYGCFPFTNAKPVVSVEIPVIQTRDIHAGDAVGYGATWVSTDTRKIATISAGYADGIFRILSNRAKLYWNGLQCPIVGRVSMDLITVDVTHLPESPKSLELFGSNQSVDDLAAEASTIGYEMLTNLSSRYNKIHVFYQ